MKVMIIWAAAAGALSLLGLYIGFLSGRSGHKELEQERDDSIARVKRAEKENKEQAKLLATKRKEENTVANLALSLPNVVRELNRENMDTSEIPRLIMGLAESIFQPGQLLFYLTRPGREGQNSRELHLVEYKGLPHVPDEIKRIPFGEGKIGWAAAHGLDRLKADWMTMSRTDSITITNNHPLLKLDIVGPMMHTTRQGKEDVLGVIALGDPGLQPRNQKLMFQMVTNLGSLAIVNGRNMLRLREQANHDGLTGLWTKSFFMHELATLMFETRKRADRLAVFIFDIDHFKTYNDTNGHPAGDALLRKLSALLKQSMRPGDWICRYGGEEFMIAMPGTDGDDAYEVADRIRHTIEQHDFEHQEKQPNGNVTISGGVAVYPNDGNSNEELIRHADEALYESKRSGRNAVTRYKGVEIGDMSSETDIDMFPAQVRE